MAQRHIQLFRNGEPVTNNAFITHAKVVEFLMGENSPLNTLGVKDGELVLYRYKLNDSNDIHTIVLAASVTGTDENLTKTFEVVANYDHLTNLITDLDATVRGTSDGQVSAIPTELTVSGNTGAYVAVEVVEKDGKITSVNVKENIDDTIKSAIEALDGNATIATVTNGVVTLKAGIVEADGIISNSDTTTAPDITLAKVATTGAAADVSIADTDGVITAETVEGALEEIAKEIDGMDYNVSDEEGFQPTAQGEKVKVTIQQKDGKITNVDVDETALQNALDKLEAATTLEGVDAIEVNYDESGNGGTVSLKIANGEKVLSQGEENNVGLKTTLAIQYNSTNKEIELLGINNQVVSSFDATVFIKDGMLKDAEIITASAADQAIDPSVVIGERYIKFTFKTYQQGQQGEADLKVEYLAVEDLFDSYTAGNEWIEFNQNTNEISHKLSAVIPTAGEDEEQATSKTVGNATATTVDNASETVTFKVPTITVDRAGHVTAASDSEITITLPSYIGTAVQTITGEANVLNNSEYVNVKAVKTNEGVEGEVEYTLTSTVKTQDVANAAAATEGTPAVDGLATALDVKQFVLDNSASVAAAVDETTVAKSDDQPYVYTVGLADVTRTDNPTTAEDGTTLSYTNSFADNEPTFEYVRAIRTDAKGRVTAVETVTMTEDIDAGTY